MHPRSVDRRRHLSLPECRGFLGIPDVPYVIEQPVASVHARGLAPPQNEGLKQEYVYSLWLQWLYKSIFGCVIDLG